MDLYLDDSYPGDACYGEDFLTGAAQGDIVVETADGPVMRREKVLVTGRAIDFEGRICIGERTVRHLAHKLDMVDDWRVKMVRDDNESLRSQLVDLSTELARERGRVQFLEELEHEAPAKVYLAFDGTEHASRRAAIEQSAAAAGLETQTLLNLRPTPVPLETSI